MKIDENKGKINLFYNTYLLININIDIRNEYVSLSKYYINKKLL